MKTRFSGLLKKPNYYLMDKHIKQLISEVNAAVEALQYGQKPVELYEPIRYIMALGGKRMRPLLTLLSYQLYKSHYQSALPAALSVEIFHNFSLLHDDIMDNAPLRRGQATVHEKWDANIAILSGDVMLVKAYEQLLANVPEHNLKKALAAFNQCATEVCEGQQIDMNFEKMPTVSEEVYLDMIRQKTAVLLGFSLQLGGLLADCSDKEQQLLYELGVNMGIGFQLMDDLLDVYADQEKFGKQVGGDIIANKKTFLLIKALQKAEGASKQQLDKWLSATEFDKAEKVRAVTQIYNELGIKELTEQLMNNYFELAFQNLADIKVEEARKQPLISLMNYLIEREQ